jgi:hypothetical protein
MVANHASHDGVLKLLAGAGLGPAPPTRPLDRESREAWALLESLDDAMFAAISGDATAMALARDLWLCAVRVLNDELVDESREHYLRFAVEAARRFECSEVRDPAKAVVAVEVIELLTA